MNITSLSRGEYVKDPAAVLDFVFDWSQWLTTGETINTHTVTVDADLVLNSHTATGTTVTVWLSGGTPTTTNTYKVVCHIVTSAGRTDERTMRISVRNR